MFRLPRSFCNSASFQEIASRSLFGPSAVFQTTLHPKSLKIGGEIERVKANRTFHFTPLLALAGQVKLLYVIARRAIKLLHSPSFAAFGVRVASIEEKCDYHGSTSDPEGS